jgi:hypothetical protein
MRKATIAVLILGVVALSGCAQTGTFTAGNLTTVELSEPNYEVVATGVSGTAKAGCLIGNSFSIGERSGSISLFRVSGTGHLYKEAMEGLWADFESKHGPVAGRRLGADQHSLRRRYAQLPRLQRHRRVPPRRCCRIH